MSTPTADPGLANERTALAWQRTALSVVVCAAILARLLGDAPGPPVAVVLGLPILLSVWVFLQSRGRYKRAGGPSGTTRTRGGRAPLAIAVATFLLCSTELLALVSR